MRKLLLLSLWAGLMTTAHAEKKTIEPPEFSGSVRPYSPAVLVDGTLYVSGLIGADLKNNQVPAEFEAEVKMALGNAGIILKAAGMEYKDVVSVQVYLTDMTLFGRMNKVYADFFKAPLPARTTVGVTQLAAPAAHIEITITARKS